MQQTGLTPEKFTEQKFGQELINRRLSMGIQKRMTINEFKQEEESDINSQEDNQKYIKRMKDKRKKKKMNMITDIKLHRNEIQEDIQ